MKAFILLLFTVILFGSCVKEDSDSYSLQVGQMLPEFAIEDNEGQLISPEFLKDKVCVLAFVNTECPDCRKELPELQAAYELFKDNASVCFLAIGRNENADALAEYWKVHSLTIPYSGQHSDLIYKKFASTGIPRIYVVNGNGMIVYVGEPDSVPDRDELCAEIQRAANIHGY